MQLNLRYFPVAALALALAACGGGGGGSSGDVSATTTTVATTTTTTTALGTNYLYLANDTISYHDGFSTETPYTLKQFQAVPGIAVQWPMRGTAAIKFTIADAGSFSVASGQTLTAAVSIVDTAPGSKGVIKFYVDNVNITQGVNSVTFSVPSVAVAWVYGMAVDGSGVTLKSFGSSVADASATLSIAGSTVGSIVLGSAINSAVTEVGSVSSMSGTYKITLVLTNLSLRHADGTTFSNYTVDMPTSILGSSPAKSISGPGLEGFITLTP